MNKKLIFIIGLIILLVCASFFFLRVGDKTTNSNVITSKAVPMNYTNLEKELPKLSLIKDLPSDSSILLKFYNYNSGEEEIENTYFIKSGRVEKVDSDREAEITLKVHSKYLSEMTNQNFCSVIKKANQNGDLSYDSSLSGLGLAWKYKVLMKYKDCL